jgi:hypothetical protein
MFRLNSERSEDAGLDKGEVGVTLLETNIFVHSCGGSTMDLFVLSTEHGINGQDGGGCREPGWKCIMSRSALKKVKHLSHSYTG